ncbi:hypothetical protein [Labrys miyagiensis]|uniref:hypothetical protein n=1 Tax=Labrys miyagiensis TaxID=346912 RepID=UPI0024E0BC61|nr:hypothetical protein [Labrys miyagiensis]
MIVQEKARGGPNAPDVELIECLHQALGLAVGGAVVMAKQALRRLVHGLGIKRLADVLEQSAFRRKRRFALTLCFDASLRFLPSPANRKTL